MSGILNPPCLFLEVMPRLSFWSYPFWRPGPAKETQSDVYTKVSLQVLCLVPTMQVAVFLADQCHAKKCKSRRWSKHSSKGGNCRTAQLPWLPWKTVHLQRLILNSSRIMKKTSWRHLGQTPNGLHPKRFLTLRNLILNKLQDVCSLGSKIVENHWKLWLVRILLVSSYIIIYIDMIYVQNQIGFNT